MACFVRSRDIALLRAELEHDDLVMPDERTRAKLDIGVATTFGAVGAFVGLILVIVGSALGAATLFPEHPASIAVLFPAGLAWLTATNQVYLRFVRARIRRTLNRAHATPALASTSAISPVAFPTQPSP